MVVTYSFTYGGRQTKRHFNVSSPSSDRDIDLMFTNKPSYLQYSNVFNTHLSNFHLLTVTKLKVAFQKPHPQVIA